MMMMMMTIPRLHPCIHVLIHLFFNAILHNYKAIVTWMPADMHLLPLSPWVFLSKISNGFLERQSAHDAQSLALPLFLFTLNSVMINFLLSYICILTSVQRQYCSSFPSRPFRCATSPLPGLTWCTSPPWEPAARLPGSAQTPTHRWASWRASGRSESPGQSTQVSRCPRRSERPPSAEEEEGGAKAPPSRYNG